MTCKDCQKEIESLRAEILEQCRLNGIGGSREAALRAAYIRLEKEYEALAAQFKALRDEVPPCH